MATATLDDLDKRLLTELQREFPIIPEPWQALAANVGVPASELIAKTASLKERKVIRQLSAIFDTRSLGYQSMLVASQFAPDKIDAGAAIINQHPGVSHNYKRNDKFNLWYTVAVPPYDSIDETVQLLDELSGATVTIKLPTLHLYKIGMKLNLIEKDGREEVPEEIYDEKKRFAPKPKLTEEHIAVIRATQDDWPLVERPYAAMAETAGLTEARLIEQLRGMQQVGYLRRVAAILHHREAGFKANAMVVWQIPAEEVDRVGNAFALFGEVSHCYRRPVYPEWPYPLFTMLHAPTYSDCMKIVEKMEEKVGKFTHKNLFSTKEYKKIRLKYFSPELDEWWARHGRKSPVTNA